MYSNSNLFSEFWDGPKHAFASLFLDALGKRSQKKTPFLSGIAHIGGTPLPCRIWGCNLSPLYEKNRPNSFFYLS